MYRILIFIFLLLFQDSPHALYSTTKGRASFRSVAPQELISAKSEELHGLIDIENKTFVFSVLMRSFKGFNSALQQEHFNEKYIESEEFPEASFSGKIIEDENIEKEGIYSIRAKGKMKIHGVEQERIIRSTLTNKNGILYLSCKFNILLTEHNIKIPKVVHEKIASEVNVEVSAELYRK